MTLSVAYPTLLDAAKQRNPDGSVATIAELMNEQNMLWDYFPFVEANKFDGHFHVQRTALPTAYQRQINAGVLPTKSSEKNTTDVVTMVETYSDIDVVLAQISGDVNKFRLNQAKAHLEAITQKMSSQFISGDPTTTPEDVLGLAPRYATKGVAYNVLDGGAASGQTDCTSIYLLGLSPETIYGFYPKGSPAGLTQEDKGQVTKTDSNGKMWEVFRSHFLWHAGLAVNDWRYGVRIANIDVSDLATAGESDASAPNLTKLMSLAIDLLPNMSGITPVFLMNQTTQSYLRVLLDAKSNVHLTAQDLTGTTGFARKGVLHFHGIPIVRVDKITSAESVVA